MPTTRKKVIKTVYKDEDDSEDIGGDFSDSGTEAEISPASSSDEDAHEEIDPSSSEEFQTKKNTKKSLKNIQRQKPQFAKAFINKISKQNSADNEEDLPVSNFSVKDLTAADKLLPSLLNLSESESSDDEPKPTAEKNQKIEVLPKNLGLDIDEDNASMEYRDVWSNNEKAESEEIAKKTFLELELHKAKIEEAKKSIMNYSSHNNDEPESDIKDLLAQGEEIALDPKPVKKKKKKRLQSQSDSELEDWEEVNEAKSIPQQGLQLTVDIPDYVQRKTKRLDVAMMMKRRMNKVKKEYQVYMHKVHVLCWLGHGNFISTVLNDQEIMSATLSLMPSKECYPGKRVDMKYVEQITMWYKNKLTLKQDKHEGKFRPKAPHLKEILIEQIKNKSVTSKKYLVYIFVAMLRAIGLQCRIMLNFITVPIRPPASELHSLSTKSTDDKKNEKEIAEKKNISKKHSSKKSVIKKNIPQLDGNFDYSSDSDYENIMQLDGNNDVPPKTRSTRSATAKQSKNNIDKGDELTEESVSPPKRARRNTKTKVTERHSEEIVSKNLLSPSEQGKQQNSISSNTSTKSKPSTRRSRKTESELINKAKTVSDVTSNIPKIIVTDDKTEKSTTSKFFTEQETSVLNSNTRSLRKRALTASSHISNDSNKNEMHERKTKMRTKSTPARSANTSKYFTEDTSKLENQVQRKTTSKANKLQDIEDGKRVSHKDLLKEKNKPKNDVTGDLIHLIKNRVKESKIESRKKTIKVEEENMTSNDDSDDLPEEKAPKKVRKSSSDDEFKPIKLNPKPSTSRRHVKIDRRVLSEDDENTNNRIDVWCEIYVEELEEWVAVDVIRSKVHLVNEIYSKATHPVNYIVGWDNNNYLKDLTRRYAPQWNTVTRKQRVELLWWNTAVQPWLGPKTARDKEEDERLDRMQLEAPLPKSIAEYKNHPLYALKRHLLKYEAIYPPDAPTLGFVRGEAVYARDCVYICRSRDTWLKEAKVVRLGEKAYKVVKARPKWDRLSNKVITDKPLEIFGPWQIQDYEPPVAENGVVPRNAYGNVELFKDCMLPKGTVHIKLPGLNRVAKKLNIDCAPAMTGFDFNGGWTHPVFEGFVVCKEFEEILNEAWVKDQEEQERKEREKIDARVYGNWKKLIKGLLIRERLKLKYGFDDPSTSHDKKKSKGPRFLTKKAK